ncbi:MAG: bifunctional demethylmenaquinone methyltransferase/2-methoxy-6-polyprenyl-1,4-benzoquinol methylase UbiE [Bacteroidota bacterium]|nr:bifunctional demethylmenaquinone methyltransferase/2-methoxy-6-polyprenyl-1,4-benzoquinol methylase UbiE [Bacteroidota bacterium]
MLYHCAFGLSLQLSIDSECTKFDGQSRQALMRYYPTIGEDEHKESEVAAMFDAIAHRYDLLNLVLSFGLDRTWRRAAIRRLGEQKNGRILDVATGTGDVALATLQLEPMEVVGIDIAEVMLMSARHKVARRFPGAPIVFVQGSAERLPFETDSFDAAIVAFGVRNFSNLDAGLRSMGRVLKPRAPLVILEFGQPESKPIRAFYEMYSRLILPRIGRVLSGVTGPYKYLPDSIQAFPHGQELLVRLEECGFEDTFAEPLTFGIVSLYTGYATAGDHSD